MNETFMQFYKHMGVKQLIDMFNLLPDVLFWIKNTNSQVVHANDLYIERMGVKSLDKIIGKTDFDLNPYYLAKQYITDDKKVMAGELVTDRLEMNTLSDGTVAWFSTSKRPIYDEVGNIMGSYGITRHLQASSKILSSIEAIKAPVDYIKQHYRRPIHIEELAQVAHLSVSALERRFKKYLLKTPNQFINQIRLESARQLLVESNLTIAEIAFKCGFTDHSYFSRQFLRAFDEHPSQLRAEHRKADIT